MDNTETKATSTTTTDIPHVEEMDNDEVVNGNGTDTTTTHEEPEQQVSFSLLIKTPVEIGTIQIQVTPADTVYDIQTFLNETTETCLYSSYALHYKNEKLNDFMELSSIPDLTDGSVLEMLPVEYNERTARLHVKRLRDILNTGMLLDNQNQSTNPSLFSSYSYPEKTQQPLTEEKLQQQFEEEQQKKSKSGGNPPSQKKTKNSAVSKKQQALQEENERKEEITGISQYEKPLLSNYFPKQTATNIQCLKSMIFSGWSPVPGYRKLQGDLFYLDCTLLEGQTINITANVRGFFVNQTTLSNFNPSPSANKLLHSHCLHQVLQQVSRQFKSGLSKVLHHISTRHPYEMLPGAIPLNQWISRTKVQPQYDINKSQDSVLLVPDTDLRSQPRDWNEELQGIRELPKQTFQERIIRDRAFAKVHADFVEVAVKGAQAVISKSILPINPLDNERSHMYLYHNIFFSYALDTRDLFTHCGGDKAARASANNDLKGIRLYNLADVDGLHTVGTCIIDYCGQRIIAQTLVPGILSNESTSNVLYGSMDNGKCIKADPVFHEKLSKAAAMLHLSERPVISEPSQTEESQQESTETTKEAEQPQIVNLCTSVDSKGIIGIDGRHYILDLVRATPRDPNYPDQKNQMCILRPELVATFAEYIKDTWLSKKIQENREKRAKAKKEKEQQQQQQSGESKEQEQQQQEEEDDEDNIVIDENDKPPHISFNPNLYGNVKLGGSEEEQQKDMESLNSVGVFLKNIIIPKLIEDLIMFSAVPIDGQNLTNIMHVRGINMRYLGYLAKNEAASKVPFIQDICFNEMVSRAAKHLFNEQIHAGDQSELAVVSAHFLNCLLGTTTGQVTAEDIQKHLRISNKKKAAALSALTQTSLWEQIALLIKEKYDFEITTHSVPMESRLIVLRSLCLKVGLQVHVKDYDFTTDFTFSSEDILELQCVVKHLNPRSSDGLDLLEHGKVLLNQRKFDIAKDLLNESLTILIQVHGPIYADVAACYMNLAIVSFHKEDIDMAIEYQKNCVIVTEKVHGVDHHDTIHAYNNLAVFCQRAGRLNESMGYFKHALYLTDLLGGDYNPERASTYISIGYLLQELGNHELGIHYLRLALKHQEAIVGTDHIISAATYHHIAISFLHLKDFKEAIANEKQAFHILERELGPDHFRTKESNTLLTQLTQTAVQIQKMAIEQNKMQQQMQQQQQAAKKLSQKLSNPTNVVPLKKEELERLTTGPVNDILKYINSATKPTLNNNNNNNSNNNNNIHTTTNSSGIRPKIQLKKSTIKPNIPSTIPATTNTTTTTTTTTTTSTNNVSQKSKPKSKSSK
ncbi:hypothetical protein DLAC_01487 [Tieghemostelium lacteum]|uniref:Clustered mitochondria protein homolog n=1 Tax=Tieghemostelium lacteum TaxID=361077 RepID=A0A152A5J7_TIELA|nr:hypothetical protein DLAC_01487 [Tieghemostelium lacteum]|eukprot:KYR01500.1 hypothetical protein DLAC_01487 [Tieghemostelium lacteum]